MAEAKGAILIAGSGALATLFAARLVACGSTVQMLANWPEGLAALRESGATLEDAEGTHSFPVEVSNQPADFAGARLALVLVKSWQTERTAAQLAECLAEDGVALTLQNGLGNYEALATALGAERVALGVTTTGATLLGPGRVKAGGEGRISLGAGPRMGTVAELLEEAGFAVEVVGDVDGLAWSKLVINAAINPLTALLELPNGELLEREDARELSAALARETAAVAGAQGIGLTFADPVAAAEDVARRTADNISSMLQDVRRGAPTEVDAICGAVVRAGRRVGVAAPVNEVMWKLVRAKAGGKR
jgi:2-dehydropantoate 2-reductase